jgi:hypothetical protein
MEHVVDRGTSGHNLEDLTLHHNHGVQEAATVGSTCQYEAVLWRLMIRQTVRSE